MGLELEKSFIEQIVSGLKRRTVTKCSQWAKQYRRLGKPFPGPWTFKYHPWEVDMHDSTAELNVGQKAAQMGFTDTVLNVTFFALDVKGMDVLYVLPAKTPDAGDFSAGRFNAALELSPHLTRLFSDVQNVGHKRAGSRNLFIRGSRSRSGLKSVPIGTLILDEVDEMTQDNIPLAQERLSGQKDKMIWMLSTPTIEGTGINLYYEDSSQNHFFFPCPHCTRYIELTFPESLEITAESLSDPRIEETRLLCSNCKETLPHEQKHLFLENGIWVQGRESDKKGWYINQLYSSTVSPADIALIYLRSLQNKADEQEFYNSKLGLTHEVKGSRLTETIIRETIKPYFRGPEKSGQYLVTMGIDQGKWLHYEITAWVIGIGEDVSASANAIVIEEGQVLEFERLDHLMRTYNINFCVIDAHPERRKATEFAHRWPGIVRLCFYPEGMNTRQISLSSDDVKEPTISVDRTTWLDTSLGRFYNRKIILPQDVSQEYINHLKAITRVYKKDKNGNPISRYVTGSKPDHFAHARNYSEIALNLAMSISKNMNISSY